MCFLHIITSEPKECFVEAYMNIKNEEVLRRGKEQRSFLHVIKRRKVNWNLHILRSNCLLKHIIEEKREGKGRKDEEEDVFSYWMT